MKCVKYHMDTNMHSTVLLIIHLYYFVLFLQDKSSTALNEVCLCNFLLSKKCSVMHLFTSLPLHLQGESVEIVNPLLDQSVQHREGELILPGNTTLSSLNLAGQ